jgi:hypothetical protein
MNIQPDIGSGSLFHGLSPVDLGSLNPYGSLHVARRIQLRNPRYGRQTTSSKSTHSLIPIPGSAHNV